MLFLGIEEILAPNGVADFIRDTLGRHALYLKGTPGRFHYLMSWRSLNRLLAYGGLNYPRLRLIRGGSEIPAGEYSQAGRNGYPRLLVAEISTLLRGGATIVIDAVEQLVEPIAALCQAVENAVMAPVQAELYASLGMEDARPLQWDDSDTLLLQVEGAKSWWLFEPTAYYPAGNCSPQEPSSAPRWQGTTAPGELLYIPRGWWYGDSGLKQPALFLAVRFKRPRGVDMVWRILERASRADLMRMDIPSAEDTDGQSSYLTYVQNELAELSAKPGVLLGLLREVYELSEPRTEFNLPWSAAPEPLPPSEDHLILPLFRFPSLGRSARRRRDGAIEVPHNGRLVVFDEDAARLLERVAEPPPATLYDLVEHCSGEVPRARVLQHLSRLIENGLASVREPEANAQDLARSLAHSEGTL